MYNDKQYFDALQYVNFYNGYLWKPNCKIEYYFDEDIDNFVGLEKNSKKIILGYKKLVTDEFEKMEGTRHDDICHMLVLFKSDNKNTLYLISKNYHVGYGYIIDFKDTSKYVNFKEDANMFILKLIQLINMNVIYLKT